KVLRPAIIEVLDNPLATAELGDTVLAAQSFQHDPDLVFSREVSPRRAADVLQHLCGRFIHRHGFLYHLRSLKGYDEPEILPSSTHPICLMSADGGHIATGSSTIANTMGITDDACFAATAAFPPVTMTST